LYEGDIAHPSWTLLRQDPAFKFAIIKASEGTYYKPYWFRDNWNLLGAPGMADGKTFLRGAYHYLKFAEDGATQANYFLSQFTGGGPNDLLATDLWPVVDVEEGSERDSNRLASEQQIIDCVSAFSAQIKKSTGRKTMMYAGSLLRDMRIKDHMGCTYLWTARYTPTLPAWCYNSIGWTLDEVWGWQYCGDGTAFLVGYPSASPLGKTDITAVVMGIDKTVANL
jgi:GH25 family lysozyme M1 (1,4-beta-N-acetylmuramidase)